MDKRFYFYAHLLKASFVTFSQEGLQEQELKPLAFS
jgi:hypothetical protein